MMARLIDLEEDGQVDPEAGSGGEVAPVETANHDRPNPNVGVFSAALSCYP